MLREFMIGQFHWWFGSLIVLASFVWMMFEFPKNMRWQDKSEGEIRQARLGNILLGAFVALVFGTFSVWMIYGFVGTYYNLGR